MLPGMRRQRTFKTDTDLTAGSPLATGSFCGVAFFLTRCHGNGDRFVPENPD